MEKDANIDLAYMTNEFVGSPNEDRWNVVYVFKQKVAVIEPIELFESKQYGVPIRVNLN